MKRGCAYRRHQRRRAWKRAYRILRDVWGWPDIEADRIYMTNHMYKNRKQCSCWMCRETRRPLSPRERRSDIDMKEAGI